MEPNEILKGLIPGKGVQTNGQENCSTIAVSQPGGHYLAQTRLSSF